jgi:muramoyltetrapeptide carboxypeptidase
MAGYLNIAYPGALKPGATLGVTAPSSGVGEAMRARFNFSVEYAQAKGLKVKQGTCVFSERIVSGTAQQRADDLHGLLLDPRVQAIMPPWGGEILINMLDHVDFELIRRQKKWIAGWSDLSTLLLPITTMTGLATLHGCNFMDFPMEAPDQQLLNAYDALHLNAGKSFTQKASSRYASKWAPIRDQPRLTAYALDQVATWKVLGAERIVQVQGRLIGGCIETVCTLVGTKFGDLARFSSEYAPEGTLVYLENAESNAATMARALHQMRLAGWFEHANAVLIGRSAGPVIEKFAHVDAIEDALGGLSIPILYDLDIGHVSPQMVIVNGALANLEYQLGSGSITQILT